MKLSRPATAAGLVVALAAFLLGRQTTGRPVTPRSRPLRRSRPVPPRTQTFRDSVLEITVEKPRSRDWAMTGERGNFRAPARHPAKVLEIRREPRRAGDRFAIMELFVLDLGPGASEVEEVEKIERLGPRGDHGEFRVLEERPVTVGGHTMVRRVTLWDARGTELARHNPLVSQTKLFSIRLIRNGKLYLLIGATPAEHFEALLPEFEQALDSLRIG